MLKVFGSPLSQPTRAVLWTCVLLDVPHEFVKVDAGKGDHVSQDFRKLNPNAKFPVLQVCFYPLTLPYNAYHLTQDQDFVLWESHAIMRYLGMLQLLLLLFIH